MKIYKTMLVLILLVTLYIFNATMTLGNVTKIKGKYGQLYDNFNVFIPYIVNLDKKVNEKSYSNLYAKTRKDVYRGKDKTREAWGYDHFLVKNVKTKDLIKELIKKPENRAEELARLCELIEKRFVEIHDFTRPRNKRFFYLLSAAYMNSSNSNFYFALIWRCFFIQIRTV